MSAINYLYGGEKPLIDKIQEETDDNNGVICENTLIEIVEGYVQYWATNQRMPDDGI